jgi:hypothetical protein
LFLLKQRPLLLDIGYDRLEFPIVVDVLKYRLAIPANDAHHYNGLPVEWNENGVLPALPLENVRQLAAVVISGSIAKRDNFGVARVHVRRICNLLHRLATYSERECQHIAAIASSTKECRGCLLNMTDQKGSAFQ